MLRVSLPNSSCKRPFLLWNSWTTMHALLFLDLLTHFQCCFHQGMVRAMEKPSYCSLLEVIHCGCISVSIWSLFSFRKRSNFFFSLLEKDCILLLKWADIYLKFFTIKVKCSLHWWLQCKLKVRSIHLNNNIWKGVLFVKLSILVSPNLPLLIIVKTFALILSSDLISKIDICKHPTLIFAVRMQKKISSDDSSMKRQMLLNCRTEHQSSFKQNLCMVCCSLPGALICISNETVSCALPNLHHTMKLAFLNYFKTMMGPWNNHCNRLIAFFCFVGINYLKIQGRAAAYKSL